MDSTLLKKTFINKVPQAFPGRNFAIKSEWCPNDINLHILDIHESQEWHGHISFDDLKQSAEELEIPFEKFVVECRDALTTIDGLNNFEYSLENNKFNLIKKDKFKIQYLEVNLTINSGSKSNFTLAAVDLIELLQKELNSSKEASDGLQEKYQAMQKQVEKYLDEKNQLERSLLQKFAVLLNSKKDKIAELEDLLVEKNRLLEEAGVSTDKNNQSKRRSTDATVNDDSDNDDYMEPTQVMTQPSCSRTIPKRVKLES